MCISLTETILVQYLSYKVSIMCISLTETILVQYLSYKVSIMVYQSNRDNLSTISQL